MAGHRLLLKFQQVLVLLLLLHHSSSTDRNLLWLTRLTEYRLSYQR
jgi:hypothetical protein